MTRRKVYSLTPPRKKFAKDKARSESTFFSKARLARSRESSGLKEAALPFMDSDHKEPLVEESFKEQVMAKKVCQDSLSLESFWSKEKSAASEYRSPEDFESLKPKSFKSWQRAEYAIESLSPFTLR